MKTYTALIATDKPDSNGNQFTKECLEKMVEQAKGLPVTYNFIHEKVFGVVKKSVLTENGLIFSMELNETPNIEMLYAVPGETVIESHMINDIFVIDNANLTEISLTLTPADKHLTTIKEVDPEPNGNYSEEGLRLIKDIAKISHEFVLFNENTLADDWQFFVDLDELIHKYIREGRLPPDVRYHI
jgi:hypothetical protein